MVEEHLLTLSGSFDILIGASRKLSQQQRERKLGIFGLAFSFQISAANQRALSKLRLWFSLVFKSMEVPSAAISWCSSLSITRPSFLVNEFLRDWARAHTAARRALMAADNDIITDEAIDNVEQFQQSKDQVSQ